MMANTRVPVNGNYSLMPTAIDSRRVEHLHFGNTDAASEARALVYFLQGRNAGWQSFTNGDFHDSICNDGMSCEHRNEDMWFGALSAAGFLEFADGRYYITKQFVDNCVAAALE